MPPNDWVDPKVWYQNLPAVHVAALSLICDDASRVLLVKPNYRPDWTLPGGMAEFGESPDVTVTREVSEELGLDVAPGRLLAVDWSPPLGNRERPIIVFIFAMSPRRDQGVELQGAELDAWQFVAAEDLESRMQGPAASRIRSAIQATTTNTTAFLVRGLPVDQRPHY